MIAIIELTGRDVSPRIRRTLLLWGGLALLGGCTSILEVDNPNNVSAGALDDPAAAGAIVNGAINTNANAMSSLLNAYTPITDETFQTGSRDDYRLLDTGLLDINTNEYLQASYLIAMRARWMSEQAIAKVNKFKAEGTLLDQQLIPQAYMMGALIYDELANMFDDAAISDRTVPGKNLGEMGMVQLYDSALKWLDAGAAIATGDNRANLLGLRARVKFDRAVWLKLNPPGTTPANPLINDAGANADAASALAAMSGDYRFELLVDNSNAGDDASGGIGFEMYGRVEHTPDTASLVTINATSKRPTKVKAIDPVTGEIDAAAVKQIGRFVFADDVNHPPMTVVSKREMYLILAEAALAQGNNAGFDTNINALRALDGKVPYAGTGPTRLELLKWERRIQLIFQGRRLNDMYRFGIKDPRWISTSVAVRKPGCLLPIPLLEREANLQITGTPVCQ